MKAVPFIQKMLLTGVCIGLLTGCSWLEDWPPKGSEMARKTAPKPPESKVVGEASGDKWIDQDKGTQTADAGDQNAAQQPKGLTVDAASEDRISKLEKEVDQMSNDLKMMMPALTKLAEAQGDIQKTLGSVEPSAGNAMNATAGQQPLPLAQQQTQGSAPQPGTVAWYEEQERKKRAASGQQSSIQQQPAMQQAAYQPPPAPPQQTMPPQQAGYQQPQQAYQPPQQQYQQQAYQQPPMQQPSYQQASYSGGPVVTNVRFGEHPDKTRLVLDTSNKVAFSYNLDNNEHILMISLPQTAWAGMPQMAVAGSPLVASYNVVPDNQGGQQLMLQLKQPSRVLWAQTLDPTGPQGYRLVFDLAPL